MTFYDSVNTHLRDDGYRPGMATKKKPGPKKGDVRLAAHPLDKGFPSRLRRAMREFRDGAGIEVPELASEVRCTRATLHNYLDEAKETRLASPVLLFTIAEYLKVRLVWLIANQGPMREPAPFSNAGTAAAKYVDSKPPEQRDQFVTKIISTDGEGRFVSDTNFVKKAPEFVGRNSPLRLELKRDKIVRRFRDEDNDPVQGHLPLPPPT